MALFSSSDAEVLMPRSIMDGMVKETLTRSTVAALSGREPMRFGEHDIITFNDFPRAEFVDEGAEKSSTKGTFGSVTAKPRKAQVTMRFNDEVQWMDEDYQLGIFEELADAGAVALARALDLGLYHRINPLSGTPITTWTNYLNSTTLRVTAAGSPEAEVEAAAGLLIGTQRQITGIAFDPSYAWSLATERYADGRKKFPELGLGTEVSSYMGLPASTGDTVSGRPEARDSNGDPDDTGVRAIIGDFRSGIRWGIQRQFPVELIRHGDPDGNGDLKRYNQIALRLEIVYGWYVFPDRFAVIETA